MVAASRRLADGSGQGIWVAVVALASHLTGAQLGYTAQAGVSPGATQGLGIPQRNDPWDAPGAVTSAAALGQQQLQQQQQQQHYGAAAHVPQHLPPLMVGGVEFSRDDDIGNLEKLSNLFGQVFYSMILGQGDSATTEAWHGLSSDIWALAEHAVQVPALALAVAMVLYNYFWWIGPHTLEPNLDAGWKAAELMYIAVGHARCNDPSLPEMDYLIVQCHLRWRYTMMLAGAVGRHLVLSRRDLIAGTRVLGRLRYYFDELRRLPNSGLLHGVTPGEVNFNTEYYPSSVSRQGPVWKYPLRDVPIASFLESHYVTIRGELDAILRAGETFRSLDVQTRNAETQFGPRGDDWLTAYMFRKGEAIPEVCAHAPRTCELLSTRPEIAGCRMGGSGAGFLRMAPGGRLKPHFGNAPRLSVHLGLIVPDGEIRMNVGHESVTWQEGKVIVFDDTFVHQVVHNGADPRYVMNVWMCHPCDPSDGKLPGEATPSYCEGPEGAMARLGLMPLPPQQT